MCHNASFMYFVIWFGHEDVLETNEIQDNNSLNGMTDRVSF